MNRLERLYQIIEYLRSRPESPQTVENLAQHFTVTNRTIHRDLSLLREQEVPIHSSAGREGGVWLGAEYSMPPVGLSIGEAIGLWLAYRMGAARTPSAPGESLASAMNKVLSSLEPGKRAKFASVLNRIVVGEPRVEDIPSEARTIDPAVYRECELAVVESRRLRIDYIDKTGNETTREVDPHGMMIHAPLWYLLAYDHKREAPRMFRLDRIKLASIDPVEKFVARNPRELFFEIQAFSLEMNPSSPSSPERNMSNRSFHRN